MAIHCAGVLEGGAIGVATRTATIPKGKFLFFPILNVEVSDIEGNGNTEGELRAFANSTADFIDPANLYLKVDGQSVSDLSPYRVQSPLFKVGPLPVNNLLGAPKKTKGHSVSDGYYIMLNPLPVGDHTIDFGGHADFGGFNFMLTIKYNLTVAAHGDEPTRLPADGRSPD